MTTTLHTLLNNELLINTLNYNPQTNNDKEALLTLLIIIICVFVLLIIFDFIER